MDHGATNEEALGHKPGFGWIFKDLLQTTTQLFKQEAILATHEWQLELAKAKSALIYGAAGVPLGAVGSALLVLMVVHLLAAFGVPLWASFGLMFLVLSGAAVALLLYAKKTVSDFHAVPPTTVDTMREIAAWIKQYIAGSRA